MGLYTIYKAQNKINGKCYIGFDSAWPSRKLSHEKSVSNPRRDGRVLCPKFHHALKKYGIDSFEWEILYQNEDKEYTHRVMEPKFIREYNSQKIGYNISPGGDGNVPVLMEKIRKEGHWLKGKPRSGNYSSTTNFLKGSKTLNKNGRETRVSENLVEGYLKDGWVLGRANPKLCVNKKYNERVA